MSTTIEQRVVEMRFDNRQFESNVSTTLSTLDKLKQKLNLSGASKGLENINSAAKNVNMTGLGSAVETVSAKFSALQVMGVTALANITNSAVNTGKQIVKSLTIDPVKSGFNEYELKMNSIQTIMAGTGESLATVNQYLNELNEYSDKTIYSFQDMTNNIGKFTNAGVKLADAVAAIQGISNEAAISGASASQASHAMYNLAQALSSGYVKLIDWKSIENAQMATMEFKQQLIDTAVAMGTLNKTGDGMYETLEGKALSATKNFNDTLQDQWMTSDVLIETLKKYSDETTEIGAKATEAATKVKTFTQLMDTLKESAQSGWAQTWEILVGDFEEARVFFTELSDIFGTILGKSADRRNGLLGAALGSNYEKLVSNLNEAGVKIDEFESSVRKVVGDDKLDSYISKWGSFENAIKKGEISAEALKKALGGLTKTASENINFGDLSEKVKGNKFLYALGSASDDVKRLQTALAELGYDISPDGKFGNATYQAVMAFQRAEGIKIDGIIGEETIAALEKATKKTDELNGDVGDLSKSCDDLIDGITKKSGRELILESLLNIIKAVKRPLQAVGEAFREVFAVSGEQIYGVLEKIHSFTDKLVMKGVLDQTTWDGLKTSVKALGIEWDKFESALKNTLKENGVDVDKLIKEYGSLAKAFDEGAISLDVIKETLLGFDGVTESLIEGGKAADKVKRAFKGLFSLLKIITTFTSGVFSLGFRVLQTVLEKFDIGLLDFIANVGDSLSAVSEYIDNIIDSGIGALVDWLIPKFEAACKTMSEWMSAIKNSEPIQRLSRALDNIPSVIDRVTQAFDKGIKVVTDFIKKLKSTDIFQTVSGWFSSASDTIQGALTGISTAIDNFSVSNVGQKLQEFGKWVSDLASVIAKSEIVTTVIDSITSAFKSLGNVFSKLNPKNFSLEWLYNVSKFGRKLEGKKAFGGIKDFVKGFAGVKLDTLKWNWDDAKTKAIEKFTNFWTENSERVQKAFEKGKAVAKALKEFVFGTEDVTLPEILAVGEKFLGLVVLYTALKTIQSLTSPFDGIADGLNNLAKGVKWMAIAQAFKAMAIALGTLTLCIIILSAQDDTSKAVKAAEILGSLLLTMGVVIVALGFVFGKLKSVDFISAVGSILALAISLLLLIKVIEKLDASRLIDPLGTFTELFAMLLALALGVKIVAKAGSASFGSIAAILTMITALDKILDVIKKYDEYPWEGMEDAVRRMINMLLVLGVAIRIASGGVKAGAGVGGLAFTLIAMMLSLYMLLDIIKAYGKAVSDPNFESGQKAVLKLLGFMTLISFVLSKSPKTIIHKDLKFVSNYAGLALALLVVVGAIYVLGKLALEHKDVMIKGGNAVGQILLAFTAMVSIVGAACRGTQIGAVVSMIIGIGVVVAGLWYIIKDMQTIPWDKTLSSAGALALVLTSMTAVFAAMSKFTGDWKQSLKVSAMLIVLGGIVAVLGWVLKQMANVPWQSSIGNAVGLSILLGVMSGLLYTISGLKTEKLTKAKIKRVANSLAALSLVLIPLAAILWAMGGLGNTQNAIQNAAGLSMLLVVMVGVLQIIGGLETKNFTEAKMARVTAALFSLSAVLFALAFVLALMSSMNTTSAITNATALSVLLLVMAKVVTILGDSKTMNWKKMGTVLISMVTLSAVLYAIAGVLWVLNGINTVNAIGNVVALSAMLLAMSLALDIISKSPSMSWQKMGTVLISMATLSLILGVIAQIIAKLDGINPLIAIGNAVALGLLLNAMALALRVISGAKEMTPTKMLGMMASMIILSQLLYYLADVLIQLDSINPTKAIGNAVALGILLNTMASALLVLGFAKVFTVDAVLGMSYMTLVVYMLVPVMAALNNVSVPISTAVSIGVLLNSMALSLAILNTIHGFSGGAIAGMYAISGVVLILAGVLAALSVMQCAASISTAVSLSVLLVAMSVVYAILSATGGLAPAALGGAVGMVAVIGILGAVAMAIGGLMSMIPVDVIQSWMTGFEYFMQFIVLLAEGLGKIAAGFVVGFTDGLAEAGENLKDFANSLAGVNSEAVTGAQAVCDAVLALSGAAFVDGITNWLFGEDSLTKFSESVKSLANCIVESANVLSGVSDSDAENIKRGAEAAKPLAELSNAIPKSGGLWQDLAGESDLESWGKKIVAFADSLIAYSDKISGATIDAAKIQQSTNAAGYIKDLNNEIPKSGGIWQQIAGESDIATWGTKIVSFAQAIIDYSAILATGTINTSKIQQSATAAGYLAELNGKLTADDGIWQKVAGSKDLGNFGNTLVQFATGLLAYANTAEQIDDEKIAAIERSVTAVQKLKLVLAEIPDESGWFGKLFKGSDAGGAMSFGDSLSNLASGINRFCNVAATLDEADITAIEYTKTVITKIKELLANLPEATAITKAVNLETAVCSFENVANILSGIATMGADYSGIDSLKESIDSIISAVIEKDTSTTLTKYNELAGVARSVETCATHIAALSDKTYTGVSALIAAIDELATTNVQGAIDAFSGKADKLQGAVDGIVRAIGNGLADGAREATNGATTMIEAVIGSLLDKATNFKAIGEVLATSLKLGLTGKSDLVESAGETLGNKAKSGARSKYEDMKSGGEYLGKGFVAGVKTQYDEAYDVGYGLGEQGKQGLEDALKIQSPSRVAIRDGKFFGKGAIIGIDSMGKAVYNAGYAMGDEGIKGLSKSIARISETIDSGIDTQPTIRPVLDLSDVRAGAGAIGSMLKSNPIGVMTNVGNISTMMNRRNQNGAESEVVSAISKLRRDLANMPRESYSIGNVTYDDGSNIKDFAQAIVRQARIERRS